MKVVWQPDDFVSELASAKREAKAAFNSDNMLIEKYLVEKEYEDRWKAYSAEPNE